MLARLHRVASSEASAEQAHVVSTQRRPAARPELVLALQRSAGNHAVSQLLAPRAPLRRSGPVVARLNSRDVKSVVQSSGAKNREDLTDEVLNTIAEVTTSWEQETKVMEERWKREERVEAALTMALKNVFNGVLPNPNDPAWWRKRVRMLIAKLEAEEHQEPPATDTRQELEDLPPEEQLATPEGDVLELSQRRVIHCTMGQGVVANLRKYTLFSDQFSSCSPVVMFNKTTRTGGLFHYAASSKAQQTELTDMHDRIEPTWIGVNRRLKGTIEQDDFESLMRFFQYQLGTAENDINLIALSSSTYAVFLGEDENLGIEGSVPSLKTPYTPKPRYDATRMTSSRKLNEEVALLVNKSVYTALFATEH